MKFSELSLAYAELQAEFQVQLQNNAGFIAECVRLGRENKLLESSNIAQSKIIEDLKDRVETLEYDNRKLLDELYREEQEYYKLECLLREVEGRD